MSHAITVNSADLARLIRREGDALARHLPAARGGDVRGVHRARVASRRLRELLPVAEAALDRRLAGLRRDIRRITRALGPVRELDVTRDVLAATWTAHAWPEPVLARVDRSCARARDLRRHDMEARLARGAAADLPRQLAALASSIADSGDGRRAGALLATRLRTRARVMADAIGHVGTLYEPAALHAVRIAGKKLRYGLEIGHRAAGLDVADALRRLKSLQELLGGLHDRQIVQGWLQTVSGERGAGRALIHTLADCHAVLEGECRARHARFLTRMPKLAGIVEAAGRYTALTLVPRRPTRMREATRAAPGRADAKKAAE